MMDTSPDRFANVVSVDQIRARFDADVERFSKLEVGQKVQSDAALQLELVARAAIFATPHPRRLLDVGCGAGNYTLRLLHNADELGVAHAVRELACVYKPPQVSPWTAFPGK